MGEDLILDVRWGISPVAHKVFKAPNLVVMSSTDGRKMKFFLLRSPNNRHGKTSQNFLTRPN